MPQICHSQYDRQTISMCIGQDLFDVIQSMRPVTNGAIASVFLFLKDYTPEWLVVIIGIENALTFFLCRTKTGGPMTAYFSETAAALSFSFRAPRRLGWSFSTFYERSDETCELWYEPRESDAHAEKRVEFHL